MTPTIAFLIALLPVALAVVFGLAWLVVATWRELSGGGKLLAVCALWFAAWLVVARILSASTP